MKYFVNQRKYASDLIQLANLTNTKQVDNPMEQNVKYSKDDLELLHDATLYRKIVVSLVYLTRTRPDIAYAVLLISQFVSAPRHHHLTTVHRIIRYLRGTLSQGLFSPSTSSTHLTTY